MDLVIVCICSSLSKLSHTERSAGTILGVVRADDLHSAMGWLSKHQPRIEKTLARTHPGPVIMPKGLHYLTLTSFLGRRCPQPAGHPRPLKGQEVRVGRIEYGGHLRGPGYCSVRVPRQHSWFGFWSLEQWDLRRLVAWIEQAVGRILRMGPVQQAGSTPTQEFREPQ